MLRNLGIRWQILSALALPVLVLALVFAQVTYSARSDMREAKQTLELARASEGFAGLVTGLAAERSASVALVEDAPNAKTQLTRARSQVEQNLRTIRSEPSESFDSNPGVQQVLSRATTANGRLAAIRAAVDHGDLKAGAIVDRYSQVIAADVDIPSDLGASLSDQNETTNFQSFGRLGQAIEALAQEQLVGADAISNGKSSLSDQRALGATAVAAQQALGTFLRTAAGQQRSSLRAALAAPAARSAALTAARAAFLAAGTTRKPDVSLSTWTAIGAGQVAAVTTVLKQVSRTTIDQATSDYDAARNKLLLTLGAALILTLLTVLLALALSRRICEPLARLTRAATQMRDELPRLVQSVQWDDGLDLDLPPVTDLGHNEVSRLAAAFIDVNATTVRIAREQAGLRTAVGDMFVNVARRNQVLLARQLAFIDQLERNEVNPDALEDLFRLDHLATRMRRNAESLLVLAGVESGRRLHEPMPLSDVVRTATSEIEHYSRVSLSLAVDPPVYAHLALPLAHLLAELLENATNFSDPGSTVVVMATPTGDGVQVTVADDGIGLADADLAEINARIEQSPTANALSSQRLGFFVVGRLAQRLDAKVFLTNGRARGTAVQINLPASLFLPGAVSNAVAGPSLVTPVAVPLGAGPGQGTPFVSAFPVSDHSLTPGAAEAAVAAAWSTDPAGTPGTTAVPAPVAGFTSPSPAWSPTPPAIPDWADSSWASAIEMPATANDSGNQTTATALAAGPVAPAIPGTSGVPSQAGPVEAQPFDPQAPAPVESTPAESWPVQSWPVQSLPVQAPSAWADAPWAAAVVEQSAGSETAPTPPLEPAQQSPQSPQTPAVESPAGSSLFSGFRSLRETGSQVPPVPAPAPPAADEDPTGGFAEGVTNDWYNAVEYNAVESTGADESWPQSQSQWQLAPEHLPVPQPRPESEPDAAAGWALAPTPRLAPEAEPAPTAVPEPEPESEQPSTPGLAPIPGLAPAPYDPPMPANQAPPPSIFGLQPAVEPELESEPEPQPLPAVQNAAEPAPASRLFTGFEANPDLYAAMSFPSMDDSPAGQTSPAPAYPQAQTYSPATDFAVDPMSADPVQESLAVPGEVYQPAPEHAPGPVTGYPQIPAADATEPEPAPEHSLAEDPRMQAVMASIEILPQRTSLRTALRRGRRKGDNVAAEQAFAGNAFDPIEAAREFARREGFGDLIEPGQQPADPVEAFPQPQDLDETAGQAAPAAAAWTAVPQTGPEQFTPDWLPQPPPIPAEQAGPAGESPHPWPIFSPAGISDDAAGQHVERRRYPRSAEPEPEEPGEPGRPTRRSTLASEALTELSRLSAYSPTAMPPTTRSGLQRRPPNAASSAEPQGPVEGTGQRARTAANVRSMLAGFRAGVERGRSSGTAAAEPEPGGTGPEHEDTEGRQT